MVITEMHHKAGKNAVKGSNPIYFIVVGLPQLWKYQEVIPAQ